MKKKTKTAGNNNLLVILKSYDCSILDKATMHIASTAKTTGARIRGPIPLPVRKRKYTLLRSPHVNKKARDQFEVRTFKRVLYIAANAQTMDGLMKLEVSKGVDITIRAEKSAAE